MEAETRAVVTETGSAEGEAVAVAKGTVADGVVLRAAVTAVAAATAAAAAEATATSRR